MWDFVVGWGISESVLAGEREGVKWIGNVWSGVRARFGYLKQLGELDVVQSFWEFGLTFDLAAPS